MREQAIPMRAWAEDDKPRERLLQKGVSALSTNELLAILLRSGRAGESVSELSRRILSDCGNELSGLAKLGVHELMKKYKGIGVAKAAAVVVAMEIGRRRAYEKVAAAPVIASSAQAYAYLAPLLGDLDHEEFWVVFLNRANHVLGSERLFAGGLAGTVTDVRVLFRRALEMKAGALIVAHNHPGTSLLPSEQDRAVTENIRAAGNLLDILLYDHLIIAGNNYYSFADEGILSVSRHVK